jgi:uncharacterized OB-fold protein
MIILAIVFAFLIILLIGIPLYLILWIWGIIDAYKGAERYNAAHMTRQCMRCGAQISIHLSACPHCGNVIPGAQWSPSPEGVPPAAPYPPAQWAGTAEQAVPTAGDRCSQCGADLAPGSTFCGSCGAKVSA